MCVNTYNKSITTYILYCQLCHVTPTYLPPCPLRMSLETLADAPLQGSGFRVHVQIWTAPAAPHCQYSSPAASHQPALLQRLDPSLTEESHSTMQSECVRHCRVRHGGIC